MPPSNYSLFLGIVSNLFKGVSFSYNRNPITLEPSFFHPYQILRDVSDPQTDFEKWVSGFPPGFVVNARSEMYRSRVGWIDRGVAENKLIKFEENERIVVAPRFDDETAIGIDSSSHYFVVCCLDNFTGGIEYLKQLTIPQSGYNREYKWHKLNPFYRSIIKSNFTTILNLSCSAMFAIRSNFINSDNTLTKDQMRGLIDGCFSGFKNDPDQNYEQRSDLRKMFFDLCDRNAVHCDPDFGQVDPGEVVRILVRTLSKKDDVFQICEPRHSRLRSHESLPIQLADCIVGSLREIHDSSGGYNSPLKPLYYDSRKLPRKYRSGASV